MNIQIDEFDTKLLGRKCVRLEISNSSHLAIVSEILSKKNFDLLTLIVQFDPKLNDDLYRMGFRLITIKSLYELSNFNAATLPFNDIEIVEANSIEDLHKSEWDKILEPVIDVSRYGVDSKIGLKLAKKIYRQWLKNSFSGYAKIVYLAKYHNEAAGMITLRIVNNKPYIDLFSVTRKFHRKGIGSMLLMAIEQYIRTIPQVSEHSLFVYTQGENVSANRFYQKHNFVISNIKMVYHYYHY